MKKLVCLIAVLVLVFSLCACGAKDAAPAGSEAAAEDGQNPVMNFIGVYGHDRASIMVEADGMENAKITVTWGTFLPSTDSTIFLLVIFNNDGFFTSKSLASLTLVFILSLITFLFNPSAKST